MSDKRSQITDDDHSDSFIILALSSRPVAVMLSTGTAAFPSAPAPSPSHGRIMGPQTERDEVMASTAFTQRESLSKLHRVRPPWPIRREIPRPKSTGAAYPPIYFESNNPLYPEKKNLLCRRNCQIMEISH